MQRSKLQTWIDALKSGSYAFGRGQLRNPKTGCMCALGVAVDALAPELWEQEDADIDALGGFYERLPEILGGPVPFNPYSIIKLNDFSVDGYQPVIEFLEGQLDHADL